jgi:lactoylglutathione lyase
MQKLKLLLIVLFISGFLQAQDTITFNFAFNHLALSVKDVGLSADFYKNVLNLRQITNRSKLEGVRWFSLAEGKELHLISILRENVTTNKAVHFALTTFDFDSFVARLDKMNIAYSDWQGANHQVNIRADGVKQVFFQDPDGYWIEVNSIGENKK